MPRPPQPLPPEPAPEAEPTAELQQFEIPMFAVVAAASVEEAIAHLQASVPEGVVVAGPHQVRARPSAVMQPTGTAHDAQVERAMRGRPQLDAPTILTGELVRQLDPRRMLRDGRGSVRLEDVPSAEVVSRRDQLLEARRAAARQ